jgi:putative transposase
MPSRHVIREYSPDSYYHIYNRGVAKQVVFHDDQDKSKFIGLFERHLDPSNMSVKVDGTFYRKFNNDLEILSYCIMGNHFHLLIYCMDDQSAVSSFMRAISTAYSMYYNKKYKRVGYLFQGKFKASRISNDAYLTHISRYIHLNPRRYLGYRFSSLHYYFDAMSRPVWLHPEKIEELFSSKSEYLRFLADYEEYKEMLDTLKSELADQS